MSHTAGIADRPEPMGSGFIRYEGLSVVPLVNDHTRIVRCKELYENCCHAPPPVPHREVKVNRVLAQAPRSCLETGGCLEESKGKSTQNL